MISDVAMAPSRALSSAGSRVGAAARSSSSSAAPAAAAAPAAGCGLGG